MPSDLIPVVRTELINNHRIVAWWGVPKWKQPNRIRRSKLKLVYLPYSILPESFLKVHTQPVELMVVILMEGFWLQGPGWEDYVRLAIARRLKKKKASIFHGIFAPWSERVREYQQFGGTYKERTAIRNFAKSVLASQTQDLYLQGAARLCLSITANAQDQSLIYPFHWIRAILATLDEHAPYGMAAYQVEMVRQKKTMCDVLRLEGELPPA